jgi:hypothetical protein
MTAADCSVTVYAFEAAFEGAFAIENSAKIEMKY